MRNGWRWSQGGRWREWEEGREFELGSVCKIKKIIFFLLKNKIKKTNIAEHFTECIA